MAGMCLVVVPFFLLLLWGLPAQAVTTFIGEGSNFSFVDLGGYAAVIPGVGIRLTNESEFITGSALYSEPVRFKDLGSNATLSFSTTFVFSILSSLPPSQRGDGLAFMIRPNRRQNTVLPGHYLGLFENFSSMGKASNHLFAVEFDTVKNSEFNDTNDNHVGVDLNSLQSVSQQIAGHWMGNTLIELDLKSGQNIQAWVEYNHLQQELNVTIAPAGSLRPTNRLLSITNMNLSTIFEEEMFVGFSAATGLTVENHYILAWSFTTNGAAPALNTSILPNLEPKKSGLSKKLRLLVGFAAALLVLAVAAAALVWFKRQKYTEIIEEWEVEYWPHRFSYKDLHIATKGFAEEQVLGSGGFGKVYKGVLPSNGLEIAVKCIFREASEGAKEFIAEISSLGRLQHRNLVQLRGYCRRAKQLFIVYDFMPNGSLDKMIFGNPSRVLEWAQRYRILMDVGAGLLYLHEEWEQKVVHRDIKSSNVLLDSELNGKLGDFGLARLYEHDKNPHTTRVMGTLGYIAPELVHTGKATPTTDVFSFGVLMLEVACGRRPVNSSLDSVQRVLLDWARELHVKDSLMVAADPKLGGDYVKDEMDTVLKLGVLCSNPEPKARPGMKHVMQILEGQASLPSFDLPLSFETSTSENSFQFPLSFEISNTNSTGKSTAASCSASLGGR